MKSLLVALLVAASSLVARAADRPNIVLIMADDLRHRSLGCYGATNFETPHLDRLAAGGMRFDHCYSLPLCTPSRVALMTGQHNGRTFFRASTLEADQRTFGHVAKAAGYATCVAGKWKLTGKSKDSTPDRFGFDEHCVTEGLRNDSPRYKNPDILRNGELVKHSGGEYGPDVVCDHALDFMERHKDKPFLLYYPMVLVHTPLSPVPGSPGYDAATQRTDEKANYPAMVRRMDENVGRVMAKLDSLGLRERTLVLFTGDNGSIKAVEMKLKDGTVYPGGKGNTSDSGVHVPLIVNQPGRVPAGVSNALLGSPTSCRPSRKSRAQNSRRTFPAMGRAFCRTAWGNRTPRAASGSTSGSPTTRRRTKSWSSPLIRISDSTTTVASSTGPLTWRRSSHSTLLCSRVLQRPLTRNSRQRSRRAARA